MKKRPTPPPAPHPRANTGVRPYSRRRGGQGEVMLAVTGAEADALLQALTVADIKGKDAPRLTELLGKIAKAKGTTLEELGLLDGEETSPPTPSP